MESKLKQSKTNKAPREGEPPPKKTRKKKIKEEEISEIPESTPSYDPSFLEEEEDEFEISETHPENNVKYAHFVENARQQIGPHINPQDYLRNDLVEIVVDEISLEGLDGITIDALWIRISDRICERLPFSEQFQNTIWNIIIQIEQLKCFVLPKARSKLVIYNRFKHIDWESGIITEPEAFPEDVYPFSPISDEDSANKYFGSCADFKTRYEVSRDVRGSTLNAINILYGNKLVIVADQNLRNNALGLNRAKSLIKLANLPYCILERIGRSRELGEVTAGKRSLLQFHESKGLFYLRKTLLANGLIKKQQYVVRNYNQQNSSGLLLHLMRFYKEYKCVRMFYLEYIIEIMKKKPEHRLEYMELRRIVGEDLWDGGIRKLTKSADFRQYVRVDLLVPYRTIYPNASESEWKVKGRTNKERVLRVLQLKNSAVNLSGPTKEEDVKDESSDDEALGELALNSSIFNQIYKLVYESGPDGVSLKQVQKKLGVDFYTTRWTLTNLVKRGFVDSKNTDRGRIHVIKYFVHPLKEKPSTSNDTNSEEVPTKEEDENDEALSFIADVLQIDKSDLIQSNRNENSESPTSNDDPFKGHYDFIKEYKRKNRLEKYNKMNTLSSATLVLQDEEWEKSKEKFESIFENHDSFYPMPLSLEHKRIESVDINIEIDEEFVEMLNIHVNSASNALVPRKETLLHPIINDIEKAKILSDIKPRNTILKGSCEGASKMLSKYIFLSINLTVDNLISRYQSILLDIAAKGLSLEFPSDLKSEDERYSVDENKDVISLNVNVESDHIDFIKTEEDVQVFKALLIETFENPTCSYTESNDRVLLSDLNSNESLKRKLEETDVDADLKRVKQESTEELMTTETADESILKSAFNLTKLDVFMVDPMLHSHSKDEDNIETIIITSKPPDSLPESEKYVNRALSQRSVTRANFILETLQRDKIISDISKMMQTIRKMENEERLLGMVDYKSINRILHKLVVAGYVRVWKIILRYENVVRYKNIFAVATLDITSTVEVFRDQMKITFLIYAKKKAIVPTLHPTSSEIGDLSITDSSAKMRALTAIRSRKKFKYCKRSPGLYGYVPKFARIKVVHELLFYLSYGYDGDLIDAEEVPQLLKQFHTKYHKNISNLGSLYKKEISWKMFIPPLPKYRDWPETKRLGSFLISDVILRLPLSIFVKIFNISYVIPNLAPLLNDPVGKHMLLKNLPPDIRSLCFRTRKFIFDIHETICHLAYIGLVQFGSQRQKEKDQQIVYLNRRALLYDTTSSEPGYHRVTEKEYPVMRFYFENSSVVDSYWSQVWHISMNTKLGQRYSLLDKTITLLDIHSKPEMLACIAAKTPEAALEADVGYIPGDGLGACGLDSSTWVHVKRNWVISNLVGKGRKMQAQPSVSVTGVRKKYIEQAKAKSLKYARDLGKKKGKRGPSAEVTEIKSIPTNSKKIPIVRKIVPRPPPKNKPRLIQLDDLDKTIMKKMRCSRAIFSKSEDVSLLICHFAEKYLCRNAKKKVISPVVTRDIMHRLHPGKRRKASSAYLRRQRRLLRCDVGNTSDSYSCYFENDKFIQRVYSKFRNKNVGGKSVPEVHLRIAYVYLVWYVTNAYNKKLTGQQNKPEEERYIDHLTDQNISKYIKKNEVNPEIIYQNPTGADEIKLSVIRDVAHCSLGCKSDNFDLPLMLYRIYQCYPDSLLKEAITWMRRNHILSGKKFNTKHWNTKEHTGLTGGQIHSSFLYSFKQITRYPDIIYREAYEMFVTIYRKHDIEREFLAEKFEQGHGLALAEIACLHDILFSFKIPDDLLVLDPKVIDHSELIQELAVRYKFLIDQKKTAQDSEEQDISNLPRDTKSIENAIEVVFEAQKQRKTTETASSNLQYFSDTRGDKIEDAPQESTPIQIENVGEISRSLKKHIKTDLSGDTEKALQDLTSYLGNEQGEGSVRISDLAYLLTKGLFPELDDDEDRLEKLNKHFLILYPSSTFSVPKNIACEPWAEQILDVARRRGEEIEELIRSQSLIKNESSEEKIKKNVEEISGNVKDTELAFALVDFIKSKGAQGASVEELKLEFSKRTNNVALHDILTVLIRIGTVFRAGVRSFRFVHVSENTIWTIRLENDRPIPELNLDTLNTRLHLMPWIRINGTPNLKVLHNWMYVIQSFCLSHPFATLISLMKRFNFLKPVDIFSLLEYLQMLDCLRMYTYNDAEPATLFSASKVVQKRPTSILDDFDSVFIEADKTAIIKIGAYIHEGRTDIEIPFEE